MLLIFQKCPVLNGPAQTAQDWSLIICACVSISVQDLHLTIEYNCSHLTINLIWIQVVWEHLLHYTHSLSVGSVVFLLAIMLVWCVNVMLHSESLVQEHIKSLLHSTVHAVSVCVAGKHSQARLTLVNVDLTLRQNLRELPLQLTILLIIRKRLDRPDAQPRHTHTHRGKSRRKWLGWWQRNMWRWRADEEHGENATLSDWPSKHSLINRSFWLAVHNTTCGGRFTDKWLQWTSSLNHSVYMTLRCNCLNQFTETNICKTKQWEEYSHV